MSPPPSRFATRSYSTATGTAGSPRRRAEGGAPPPGSRPSLLPVAPRMEQKGRDLPRRSRRWHGSAVAPACGGRGSSAGIPAFPSPSHASDGAEGTISSTPEPKMAWIRRRLLLHSRRLHRLPSRVGSPSRCATVPPLRTDRRDAPLLPFATAARHSNPTDLRAPALTAATSWRGKGAQSARHRAGRLASRVPRRPACSRQAGEGIFCAGAERGREEGEGTI
jgi:hypothetical protein